MTPYLTSGGIALLLRALNGEELVFAHVAIGSGNPPDNPSQATELVHQEKLIDISSTSISDNTITLICETTNAGITNGFRITEYGIYAQDMDDPSRPEILYAYAVEAQNQADYMPAEGERIKTIKISPVATIASVQNISAVINGSLETITRSEFELHTGNTANPHQVTKAQVGLSEVPNVSTNDQTPTFETYSGFAGIGSGERLSLILGKIAKLFVKVMEHFRAKNPHNITTDTISAAPKSHSHKTTDINEGVFGVSRGGTGRGTFPKNSVLMGNDNADIGYVSGVGAFHRTSDSAAPTFGTLPVEMGGTGKKTSAAYNADLLSRMTQQGFPLYKAGTYTGTGSNSAVTLTFNYTPKAIIIVRGSNLNDSQDLRKGGFLIGVKGNTGVGGSTWFHDVKFTWNVNSVSFRVGISVDSTSAAAQYECNTNGIEYTYIAFF